MDLIILFAAGTFWFWLLLIISFILISLAVEFDHGIKAFLVLFGTLLVFHFANDSHVFRWIAENPGHLIAYLLGYFAIGTFWTYVKWYFFVLKKKEEAEKQLDDLKTSNLNLYNDQKKWIQKAPEVKVYKRKIIRWMAYWPFSAAWTILNDPLKRIFEWIFKRISTSLQTMSNKMFSSFNQEEFKEK